MTGDEIRRHRERLGLSQAEIGRRLDVDVVTWNRWERGRQAIRFPEILRLAFVGLGVELGLPCSAPLSPRTPRR